MSNAAQNLSSANSALIFFNDNGRVGGYYRDAEEVEYKVSGTFDANSKEVAFNILNSEGESVGTGHYKARRNPRSTVVADGEITFGDASYPVCVAHAQLGGNKKGHSVFADRMPTTVDAPF